jgi:adenosine deaminase
MMANLIYVEPLAEISVAPLIAALPKADLHLHAETDARLERILAQRAGRRPYDWRSWAQHLLAETPPGMPRLARMAADRRADAALVETLDADPDLFVSRIVDVLEEGAADGAILIEVLFGAQTVLRPDLMRCFRQAERYVQQRYPLLRAEALIAATRPASASWIDQLLPACLAMAHEGLAGIHIIPDPYDTEADWRPIYRWAERAAAAGLGIAAHAGEFSPANIAAALRVPGLTRIGHAVYAAHDTRLLEVLARSAITVECSLSCNVVLGAVQSYADHPIRQFVAHNIPVSLNTDDPMRVWTTIGREYAIAAMLGFTPAELLSFTQNAIHADLIHSLALPGRTARAAVPSPNGDTHRAFTDCDQQPS